MLTTTKPRFFTTVVIAGTWLLSSKMTTTTAFIVAGGRRSFITTASSTNQMGWKTPSNGIDTSTTTSFRSLVEQPRGQQHRHYSFFRKLFDGGDGFATKDDIEAALRSKKKATMLDVRTEKEISKDGKIVIPKTGWVNVPMSSPFDPCAPLAEKPQDILPDKEGTN